MNTLNVLEKSMKRVLVCEDDSSIAKILVIYLSNCGYEVFTAENGDDGIRLLEQYQFDAVVTDVEMPALDGYDLIRAVQNFEKPPQVFVISGLDKRDVEANMKNLQFDFLFEKPFSLLELSKKLDDSIQVL